MARPRARASSNFMRGRMLRRLRLSGRPSGSDAAATFREGAARFGRRKPGSALGPPRRQPLAEEHHAEVPMDRPDPSWLPLREGLLKLLRTPGRPEITPEQ